MVSYVLACNVVELVCYVVIFYTQYRHNRKTSKTVLKKNRCLIRYVKVSLCTYLCMCIKLIWFGPFLWPLRPLQPPPSNMNMNSEYMCKYGV